MVQMIDDDDVTIWFEDARNWERGNPYVQGIGFQIGLMEEQMDAMFIDAAARS